MKVTPQLSRKINKVGTELVLPEADIRAVVSNAPSARSLAQSAKKIASQSAAMQDAMLATKLSIAELQRSPADAAALVVMMGGGPEAVRPSSTKRSASKKAPSKKQTGREATNGGKMAPRKTDKKTYGKTVTTVIQQQAKRMGKPYAQVRKQVLRQMGRKDLRGASVTEVRALLVDMASRSGITRKPKQQTLSMGLPKTIVKQVVSQAQSQGVSKSVAQQAVAVGNQVASQLKDQGKKASVANQAGKAAAVKELKSSKPKKRKSSRKSSSSTGRRKLSTAKLKRARALTRAIKAGRVSKVGSQTNWTEMPGTERSKKLDAFLAKYKGVRTGSSRSKKSSKPTLLDLYKKTANAQPYYVRPRYKKVRDTKAPGVIAPIPGSGAKPFTQLTTTQKMRVISFLNSDKGSKFRGKFAKSMKAPTSSRIKTFKGAANIDEFWY